MTEKEFNERLTQAEKNRLDELADNISDCKGNSYSFMQYWATRINEVLAEAHKRIEADKNG